MRHRPGWLTWPGQARAESSEVPKVPKPDRKFIFRSIYIQEIKARQRRAKEILALCLSGDPGNNKFQCKYPNAAVQGYWKAARIENDGEQINFESAKGGLRPPAQDQRLVMH